MYSVCTFILRKYTWLRLKGVGIMGVLVVFMGSQPNLHYAYRYKLSVGYQTFKLQGII